MSMNRNFIEVHLRGLAVSPSGGSPLALLLDHDEKRGLSIPMGPSGAADIILNMEGISQAQLPTHDLLASIFTEGGFVLEEAAIFRRGRGPIEAHILYSREGTQRVRDLSPSDAIALALRLKAPIFAATCLLSPSREAEESLRFASGASAGGTPAPYYYRCSNLSDSSS